MRKLFVFVFEKRSNRLFCFFLLEFPSEFKSMISDGFGIFRALDIGSLNKRRNINCRFFGRTQSGFATNEDCRFSPNGFGGGGCKNRGGGYNVFILNQLSGLKNSWFFCSRSIFDRQFFQHRCGKRNHVPDEANACLFIGISLTECKCSKPWSFIIDFLANKKIGFTSLLRNFSSHLDGDPTGSSQLNLVRCQLVDDVISAQFPFAKFGSGVGVAFSNETTHCRTIML